MLKKFVDHAFYRFYFPKMLYWVHSIVKANGNECLYGPFKTRRAAKAWAEGNRSDGLWTWHIVSVFTVKPSSCYSVLSGIESLGIESLENTSKLAPRMHQEAPGAVLSA